MALPTPADAAQARNTGGFFSGLGSTILRKSPLFGPLYNAINTVTHVAEGTAGQYGPAPSPLGKLISLLSGNFTNAPRATAVTPGDPTYTQPTVQPPIQPPADPNNPVAAPPPPPAGTLTIQDLLGNNRIWNALRPPFGVTSQQFNFPGSAIGPFQGPINPYDPKAPVAPFNSLIGDYSLSPLASLLQANVRARNIP